MREKSHGTAKVSEEYTLRWNFSSFGVEDTAKSKQFCCSK